MADVICKYMYRPLILKLCHRITVKRLLYQNEQEILVMGVKIVSSESDSGCFEISAVAENVFGFVGHC